MIEFEDPEAKYDYDPPKGREIYTAIRVMTIFIIFLMMVLALALNGYRFDFVETEIFSFLAGENHSSSRLDKLDL